MSELAIVVGLVSGHERAVVSTAATFAARFDAELVCVEVDTARYAVGTAEDGAVVSAPLDPDLGDEAVEAFDAEVERAIAETLEGSGVRWSTKALAGGPAQELARLADQLDAEMIVVGTRDPGLKASLHEFFNGSVAAQLAHRQHRPVVVVPLRPVGPDGDLPWS